MNTWLNEKNITSSANCSTPSSVQDQTVGFGGTWNPDVTAPCDLAISTENSTVTVLTGSSTIFNCSATPTTNLTITWLDPSGNTIASGGVYEINSTEGKTNSYTFIIIITVNIFLSKKTL